MKVFSKTASWKKVLLQNWRTAVIVAVLVGTIFWVFWPSLLHVFRGDHIAYMIEMEPRSGLGELLKASYSYPRTREISPGDQLLFRPLLYVLLAVETWLFRYDFFYWQLISLLLHVVVVLELYFLFRRYSSSYLAVFLALNFSVLYVGAEMVTWHHIVGYLLFAALFLPGFYGAMRYAQSGQQDRKYLFLAAGCIGVSAFAYEFGIIAGGILWTVLLWQRWTLRQAKASPQGPLWVFWVLPVIYGGWSIADYFQYITVPHPETWSFAWNVVWIGIERIYVLLQEGLLFPAALTLIFEDRARFFPISDLFVFNQGFWDKLYFVMQRSRESFVFLMNFVALLCLGIAAVVYSLLRIKEWFGRARPADRKRSSGISAEFFMTVAAGGIILTYFLLLLFGRYVSRGEELVYKSLYYVYLLAMFLAMAGYFLLFISGPLKGRLGRAVIVLLSISFLCLAGANAVRTKRYLLKQVYYQNLFRQYLSSFNRFIKQHAHEPDFTFDIYWSNNRFFAWDTAAMSIDQQDFANLLFTKYLNNSLPKYYVVFTIEQGLRAFRTHEEARTYVLQDVLKTQKPPQPSPPLNLKEEKLLLERP